MPQFGAPAAFAPGPSPRRSRAVTHPLPRVRGRDCLQIEQRQWTPAAGWRWHESPRASACPQLVLLFGDWNCVSAPERYHEARAMYPGAHIVSASTAGEILGTGVHDRSISLTALQFDESPVAAVAAPIERPEGSRAVGLAL